MKILILINLLLIGCDIENNIANDHNLNFPVSPREYCVSLNIFQVECFCIDFGCKGRNTACFWNTSYNNLQKRPDMLSLYEIFYNEMLECSYNYYITKEVNFCEDEVLERALDRCEQKIKEEYYEEDASI